MTARLPVLALPGILLGRRSWEPVEDLIAAEGRAFAPFSFPGYDGRARIALWAPTPYHYAASVAKDAPERAHVFAHCSGCNTAVAYAHLYPSRVASLTLIAYWHGTKEWESRQALKWQGVRAYAESKVPFVIDVDTCAPELPAKLAGWMCDALTDEEGLYQLARSICYFGTKDILAQLSCPIHFIVGLRDAVTLPAAQVRIACRQPGAQATLFDCGHSAHWEMPAATIKAAATMWGARD